MKALGWLLLAAGLAAPRPARAESADNPIAVTIVDEEPCAPRLQDVVTEQLADVTRAVTWRCEPRLDLQGPAPAPVGPRIWIDLLSSAREARLMLGDARGDRFVVRRVPLATGLDEIGREEIAHILRSAILALLSGKSETLTRAEAEAAVSTWAPPATTPSPAASDGAPPEADARPRPPPEASAAKEAAPAAAGPVPAWRPVVEVGPALSLQAFSREIPVVQEAALSLTVAGTDGPLALWAEVGYRLPATYRGENVGVSLDALSLRLGPALRLRTGRSLVVGLALGAGAEWIGFTPRAGSYGAGAFALAPEGRFVALSGRVALSLVYVPADHLRIALRLFCDVAASDVHYDYRDTGGAAQRVVSAFPLSPGAGLLVAWRS